MFLRTLTLVAGLAGAGTLSQFPEYAQQYAQRLGGAVDELGRVVQDFDRSAAAEGLSREAALAQMQGTDFLLRRRTDMEGNIARHARLSADLEALQQAGPFMRAYHARRLADPEIARKALKDFKPALPVTLEGGIFAGVGLLGGIGAMSLLLAILRLPFRRRGPQRG